MLDVLGRHRGEAGIIYCIRRKDVDALAADCVAAASGRCAYHAGMDSERATRPRKHSRRKPAM